MSGAGLGVLHIEGIFDGSLMGGWEGGRRNVWGFGGGGGVGGGVGVGVGVGVGDKKRKRCLMIERGLRFD